MAEAGNGGRRATIDSGSHVSLGTATLCVVVIVGACWALWGWASDEHAKLRQNDVEQARIVNELSAATRVLQEVQRSQSALLRDVSVTSQQTRESLIRIESRLGTSRRDRDGD